MNLFLGLDSSTQSLSAIVIDADAGQIVKEVSLNYGRELPQFNCPQGVLANPDPLVCHADPLLWAAALDLLCAELRNQGVPLAEIRGISGSGQQHGTVYLDGCFADSRITWDPRSDLVTILRPHLTRKSAPIWMDSSTTGECAEIGKAAGGSERVRTLSGSPPVERFSGPQIRRFWKLEPAAYEQTGVVHLVSSFMASLLTGRSAGIDFGDGAGMNLLNLATGRWDSLLLEATAPKLESRLPCAIPSATRVGTVSPYFVVKYGFSAGTPVIAWSGDNPCSLIGVGAWEPGTAVVSLGTSYTFFAAMPEPLVDPHGYGHVFGNPAGGFMSLICFKNGALAQERVRDQFKLDWRQFETWLGATPAGNGGNMMLPYFVSEITPLVLAAKPVYRGTPEFVAGRDVAAAVRAVVEAQALRLRLHSAWMGQKTDRLRVTGGVSTSRGTCQILADVFNARVERLVTGNSAALGAALRAAQAVSGRSWAELSAAFCAPVPGADITPIPVNVAAYATVLPAYKAFVDVYKG
jgi:xylulokinase